VHPIEYSWAARAQADSLPVAGKRALAEAIEELRRDPWQGHRVPGYPPEFRTWSFGDWGLVVYVIHERRVIVLDIIWAGP
jgi:hypothetical protein